MNPEHHDWISDGMGGVTGMYECINCGIKCRLYRMPKPDEKMLHLENGIEIHLNCLEVQMFRVHES